MTLTTESEDKRIEFYYDSEKDKDHFELTVQGKHGCFTTVNVNRHDVPELINTLTYFDRMMKLTTGR